MALPPLGLQMGIFGKKYDLKKEEDLNMALNAVVQGGYVGVECGWDLDAELFKKKMHTRGLKMFGTHIALSGYKEEHFKPMVDFLHAQGCVDVCNSGLLRWGDDLKLADYQAAIPVLQKLDKALRVEGLFLRYHHHSFEFKKIDGHKTGMDILWDALACDFCIDVAWVKKGGSDPAEYLKKHEKRISYLHLKDYFQNGPLPENKDDKWCQIGQDGKGAVDFKSVLAAVKTMPNVRYCVVEQDTTYDVDPRIAAANSRRELLEGHHYF